MSDNAKHIEAILERNKRVEADKAWEVSMFRRLFITTTTYLTGCMFLWLIDQPYFYFHAFVPTGGYILSTLSLPWIKQWWIKRNV